MKYNVIGIGPRRSGTSSKGGKPYDMTALYCICTAADVTGHKAEEIVFNHLSGITFPDISVGDIIDVGYDKRGFMVDFALAEKAAGKNLKINASQT